jgi:fucose permease
MAVFESSKGNFIPFYIEEFKTDNTAISFALSMSTVGCIIGSFLGGHLCERFGHKLVYITGSVISTIAVLIAPFTSSIGMLGVFNFIFGLGRSSLAVAVDTMVPVLSFGFEAILMNITHFMYGLGSFAGQSAYGHMLSIGLSWRRIFMYLGVFFIASIFISLVVKTPNTKISYVKKEAGRKELLRNPVLYLFMLAVTFSCVAEMTINAWYISYIRSSYGFGPAQAAKYASIFFFMYAVGRLAGGFVINKLGDLKGLIIYLFTGAVFIAAGLVLREKGLIMMALSGFFISVSFPTLMVLASKTFKGSTSFAIGLITTVSNILYAAVFNLTGVINDSRGSFVMFFIVPLSMAACIVVLGMISRKVSYIE